MNKKQEFKVGDRVLFKDYDNKMLKRYYSEDSGIDSSLIKHGTLVWNGETAEVIGISAGKIVVRYGGENRIMQLGFNEEDLIKVGRGRPKKVKPYHPKYLVIEESCNNLSLKDSLSELKETSKIYKLVPLKRLVKTTVMKQERMKR